LATHALFVNFARVSTTVHIIFIAQSIDALDEQKSEIHYFRGTDRIMLVTTYALEAASLEGKSAFRLPFRSSPTFFDQAFVDRVQKEGLEGLEFLPANVELV